MSAFFNTYGCRNLCETQGVGRGNKKNHSSPSLTTVDACRADCEIGTVRYRDSPNIKNRFVRICVPLSITVLLVLWGIRIGHIYSLCWISIWQFGKSLPTWARRNIFLTRSLPLSFFLSFLLWQRSGRPRRRKVNFKWSAAAEDDAGSLAAPSRFLREVYIDRASEKKCHLLWVLGW